MLLNIVYVWEELEKIACPHILDDLHAVDTIVPKNYWNF